ncbi:MAG: HAD family phosphatase [Firmicutes bacterium]|nr:HAD family phosphatase [Bacillota bacterium]
MPQPPLRRLEVCVMSIKAIIFDMDGVIFDSERLILDCWIKVAKKYGIDDIEQTCRACIGINRQATEATFYRRYGENFDYDKYRHEAADMFFASLENGILPIKTGVRELLDFIEKSNIPAAIASSTKAEIVTRELRDAGLLDHFYGIVGGDMVQNSKPAPDIFLLAAEKLGVKPEECLVIEDSHNGIRAAANANMHSIMVPDLLPPTDEMRELSDKVLDTLLDVKEYIRKCL